VGSILDVSDRSKRLALTAAILLAACSPGAGTTATGTGASAFATLGTAEGSSAVTSPSPTIVPVVTLATTAEPAREAPLGAIELLMTFGPRFVPAEATATAGTVMFFLRNDPGEGFPVEHDFVLGPTLDSPPLAASPAVLAHKSMTFTVQRLVPGTYTYWCRVRSVDGKSHSSLGMVGTLTITP
jgi:plastocyanin